MRKNSIIVILIIFFFVSIDSDNIQSTIATSSFINNPIRNGLRNYSIASILDASNPVYLPVVSKNEPSWPMVAANPERTSWTSEEIKGTLSPRWYKPFEAYIAPKIQVIAANNMLFISTSRGIYALDAGTGKERWVYPSELPLGNSPTYHQGVVYVGGMDHKIHAINAENGQRLWTFEAEAGFDTNPLVAEGMLFAGSRDGVFYAISIQEGTRGNLAWSYKAQGAIHFSAAFKEGVVYFSADDNYAYALNALNGNVVWKSTKLPGSGFQSWWPVIYEDHLILSGSSAYRTYLPPGNLVNGQHGVESSCLFPQGHLPNYLIGNRDASGWINAFRAAECIENYSYRRTYIVLNRRTGVEETYNFDGDGKPDYAPMLWHGARAGNRYPAIVGIDHILYQSIPYITDQYSFRGQVSGWQLGTSKISTPSAVTLANDEPMAYSAGGSVIYWTLCCDRSAGAFDLSKPNPGSIDPSREWLYYDEGGRKLSNLIPGYNMMYRSTDIDAVFGGINGVYGLHGDQSPPIPYAGKVYMIRSNTLIAFDSSSAPAVQLPTSHIIETEDSVSTNVSQLKQKLAVEVQKILDAGHLRPGYGISGNFDRVGQSECGENTLDYFHEPADSVYTLIRALPHLSPAMQAAAKTYIQKEFADYPPYQYVHIGWATGASREAFELPLEVNAGRSNFPASAYPANNFIGWDYPPHLYYTLWKYAQVFPGSAKSIFDAANKPASKLENPPADSVLIERPYINNAYIAGYMGYLELQAMAGYPKDIIKQAVLDRLIALRLSTFSKDSPYGQFTCTPGTMSAACYCKTTNTARNFLYLTPELGDRLNAAISYNKVQEGVIEYNRVTPYWFVSNFEATYAEGVVQPLQDVHAVFQAKGLILQEPFSELAKYLDVPAFSVGDYYYIQNLVTAIEANQ